MPPAPVVELEGPFLGRAHRFIAATLLVLFAASCLLHLHGFSLAEWHGELDGSEAEEVLLGQSRRIRSDDWAFALPLILSQSAVRPAFPVKSDLVGYGNVDTRVGYSLPVRSWVSLFRPQVWGYFFGRDFGLAWHWWFRAFALVYGFWLLSCLVTRGRVWQSLAAAVALLFAPFFQFWSMDSEPMAAMGALSCVALAAVALARKRTHILLAGMAFAWTSACFLLAFFYPPLQVPLGYLFLVLVFGLFLRERQALVAAGDRRFRWVVGGSACAVAVLCAAFYVIESRETFRALAATVFPGSRAEVGGELTWQRLLSNVYTAARGVAAGAPLGNICEGASFFHLFPPLLAMLLVERLCARRRLDPVAVALSLYLCVLVIYAAYGFPAWLARATLFSRVPDSRSVIGIGVAGLLLGVRHVADTDALSGWSRRAVPIVLATAWGGATLAICLPLRTLPPGMPLAWMAAATALLVAATALVLARWRFALALVAGLSVLATGWFNPLVRGGSDYLVSNRVSRTLLDIDRSSPQRPLWVVYDGGGIANLLRALGVRCLNGVHYTPQFELWSRLDPAGEARHYYNRYAQVVFTLPPKVEEMSLSLPLQDTVIVSLHPDTEAFARLGVTHLLHVGDDASEFEACRSLEKLATVGNKHFFRVRR